MLKTIKLLPRILELYQNWVKNNPQAVGDVEMTVKWLSYIVTGRISNSEAMSEFIYSLSNLLVLYNDQLILKSSHINDNDEITQISDSEKKLKLFLTILEYCEVFIEYSAKKFYGKSGRWMLIVSVQLIKFLGRFLLIFNYKNKIVQSPPIPTLDRKKVKVKVDECYQSNSEVSFILKRSGRVIRKIEGAPPLYLRDWKSIQVETDENSYVKLAEMLYITKPLIHLGSVAKFGYKSWKSYSIALLLDLISLRLYYLNRQSLKKSQRVELSHRCVLLVLYILRSPFYDKYSKDRILAFLNALSRNIPLANLICTPLISYLQPFQSTYFYMWST